MTTGERIKGIRKSLSLTLDEFGSRIGVTKTTISRLENNINNVTDQMTKSICREFNVNESWLLTGEGNMFMQPEGDDALAAAVEKLMSGETAAFKRRLISVLSRLEESQWVILEQKLREILGDREVNPRMTPEQEIDAKVEAYRQQLLAEQARPAGKIPASEWTREMYHQLIDGQLDLEEDTGSDPGKSSA